MCGRYTLTVPDPDVVAQTFDLQTAPADLTPRYNIAPTQPVATIVKNPDGNNEFVWMRWGLIPSWAKDPAIGNKMINARAETLSEKPAFRTAYKARRCLVVADGFYEWQKNADGSKTPYYIRLREADVFGLAGLWEQWKNPETGELVKSCTIVTGEPNDLIKSLHDRMAVILPRSEYATWLNPKITDVRQLQPLLQPYPAESMVAFPVSPRVNNPRYDAPDLIDPVH